MADIRLSDFLTLIVTDLVASIEQTAERAEAARMRVSDVDLDIPALVSLETDTPETADGAQVMVRLPSTRDALPGRVGRVRILFEAHGPGEESP